MIKDIKYSIGILKLGFRNSDFITPSDPLELIPIIKVEVKFDKYILKDIYVYYTRNGFVVSLTHNLTIDQNKKLEYFISHNKKFLDDFNWFINSIKSCKMFGGSS